MLRNDDSFITSKPTDIDIRTITERDERNIVSLPSPETHIILISVGSAVKEMWPCNGAIGPPSANETTLLKATS